MNKCVYCGSEGLEDVVIYVDYACKAGGAVTPSSCQVLVNNGLWFVSLLRHRTQTTSVTLRFFFSFSAGEMLKVVSALWIWQPGWVMYRLPPADLKRKVQAD